MKRSKVLILAVIGMALVLSSGVAIAESLVDQQQTSYDSGFALVDDGSTPQLGQTFTAGRSGLLDKVSLYVGCCTDASGNTGGSPPEAGLMVAVYPADASGLPQVGIPYVASGAVPAASFPTDGSLGWVDVPLRPSSTLEGLVNAGQKYAVVISINHVYSVDPTPPTTTIGYQWGRTTPSAYSGGTASSADTNGTWQAQDQFDFAFKTYVASDATAPVVTKAPAQTLTSGSTLGTSAVPVELGWSATDDSTGGIARYELQQSDDGGNSWSGVTLSSATQTSITRQLTPGKTYAFQVRAQDGAGNWSAWKPGPTFKVNLVQESDSPIAYTGTWNAQSLTSFSGGGAKYASSPGTTPGRSANLTQNKIQNIGWVSTKGKNRGKAEVRVDGTKVGISDLYASNTQYRKVVYAKNQLDPSVSHSLETRPLGTKNASSSGTRVDMDALVVLSSP